MIGTTTAGEQLRSLVREARHHEEPRRVVAMKFCPDCKRDHPESEFYVCRASPDGLPGICKSCVRERQAYYR